MTATAINPLAPPHTLYLNTAAVARLNFQPRLCPPPLECIASRRGDVVELVFGSGYDPTSRPIEGPRHLYRVTPHSETVLLATRIGQR